MPLFCSKTITNRFIKIKNWARIWNNLKIGEKIWLGIFCVLILFSISYLVGKFYQNQTRAVPVFGGTYVEAISESPHNLNPLLSTNDSDRDLSNLIFSSLLKYNEKSELIPDLASSYAISKDRKTYTIKLKNGIVWHDGEPFSAEDIVFTINAAQNPEYNSPLRASWQGVKAEASDKYTVILTLKTPYGAFTENLALLGILPKHIWENVVPQSFPLADFNFNPIGTGPYRFVKLQKDSLGRIISVNLTANANYFASAPFIKNLVLNSHSKIPKTISIKEDSKGEVQAKDIKTDETIEIINPDLHIATLTKDTKFYLEMEVARGRGYVPSELNKKEDQALGVISIDSIFTPVKKVNFNVENTRVGQRTDYDKLFLEITTNGAISPKDALLYASNILQRHMDIFVNFGQLPDDIAEDEPEMTKEEIALYEKLRLPISELELSVRSSNCLREASIKIIADLVKKAEEEMLSFKNFGKKLILNNDQFNACVDALKYKEAIKASDTQARAAGVIALPSFFIYSS